MTLHGFRGLLATSALVFGLRLAGAVLALGLQLFLARWLGAGELGVYALAVAAAGPVSVLCGLGYPSITPRFVPALLADGRRDLAAAFVRSGRRTTALASGCALVGAIAVAALPVDLIESQTRLALAAGLLAAPLLALMRLNGALAISLRAPLVCYLPDLVLKPAMLLAGAAAVVWLLPQPGAAAVLAVLVASLLVLALGQTLMLTRRGREVLAAPLRPAPVAHWRRAALPMMAVVILTSFVGDLDIVLLAALLAPEEIAVFSVCFRISMLIGFAVQVVFQLLMPDLSQAYARNRRDDIRQALRWANGATTAFATVALGAAALGGDELLGAFGEEFRAGGRALVLLVAVQLAAAAFGPNAQLLNLAGRQMKMIPVFACGLALLGVLNVVLVPRFGIDGAAAGFLVAALFWHAWLSRKVVAAYGFHGSALALLVRSRPAAAGP